MRSSNNSSSKNKNNSSNNNNNNNNNNVKNKNASSPKSVSHGHGVNHNSTLKPATLLLSVLVAVLAGIIYTTQLIGQDSATTTTTTTTSRTSTGAGTTSNSASKTMSTSSSSNQEEEDVNYYNSFQEMSLDYKVSHHDEALKSLKHWADDVSFVLHRNGEVKACTQDLIPGKSLREAMHIIMQQEKLHEYNTYDFESIFTTAFALHLLPSTSCGPETKPSDIVVSPRKTWGRGSDYTIHPDATSFLNFCDMGVEHTTWWPDHDSLVPVKFNVSSSSANADASTNKDEKVATSLPCHFHTREGKPLLTTRDLYDLVQNAKQLISNTDDVTTACTFTENGEYKCQPKHITTTTDDSPASTPKPHHVDSNTSTTKISIEIHLYAVPAGRVFMFAPSYVGEEFHLNHVPVPTTQKEQQQQPNTPITLVVLSLKPRIFDILDFFTPQESDELVQIALTETRDSHRIKRSSTGATGYNVNSQRTSENGFDTDSSTSLGLKKRAFSLLGLPKYIESFADGLQILRYNKTTAYVSHMDYIDDPGNTSPHDYISSRTGTNRFATILLYMSNLGEKDGGETVFPKVYPPDLPPSERISRFQVLEQLRESGEIDFLKRGSWEESMVADCRTKLAIRPNAARAVLFYSQHPNGEEDTDSIHGACPILNGDKWAANLWVWNGPRDGYPDAPRKNKTKNNQKRESSDSSTDNVITANTAGRIHGTFSNSGKDPTFAKANLYYEDQLWGPLSHGSPPMSVNTFEGHRWNVRSEDGKILKRWVIPKEPADQKYEV